ncbi:hypothetical protein KEM56_007866 [Ascosphaera pollenicola]|nr:hypothetical protein KEM56_007866 [Ascosphaera pollenicola]
MLLSARGVAFCLVSCLVCLASASIEKTIFIAPPKTPLSAKEANLASSLSWLMPDSHMKRTHIPVIFSPLDAERPAGTETWFYLSELTPGQRHEVRVCWLATQPTEFWLDAFTIDEVRESLALNASIESFIASEQGQKQLDGKSADIGTKVNSENVLAISSSLFLRLIAAADYFTLNETLMQSPEPVHVDLILDPFLANIFPRSLVPVGIYISIVAVIAWFVSGIIWKFISGISDSDVAVQEKMTKDKKTA